MRPHGRAGRTQRQPGVMNRLESKYADYLTERQLLGEITDFKFEKFKLRLAKNCYITVDFAVMLADGTIEFHECKGFMEEDAAVKLKVVAEEFWWFRFVLVQARPKKSGGGFSITPIEP